MRIRRVASVAVVAGLVLAACGSDDDSSSSATDAPSGTEASGDGSEASGDCVVGVSWNNFQEPRWGNFDEPAIKAAVEAGGGSYVSNDAKSSAETQASNVENLISQGANVVIILAQDGTAILPSVEAATTAGIPVIAYDRLIEDSNALYVTFNNEKVGELQAQAIFDEVPTGNWVIIKGNSADANADFLRGGAEKVIGEAVAAGDIVIVGEDYTDNWDPANAQATMEGYLTANGNDIQAALVQNDGMAGGVVAALEAQGLAGQVPVSGQDGDAPGLNRVALGTQTVDVWKDGRELGKVAGEAAVALCAEPRPRCRVGYSTVHDPRGRRRDVDHPRSDADHAGQPRRRRGRRLDHAGGSLQGRRGRFGRGLSLNRRWSDIDRNN